MSASEEEHYDEGLVESIKLENDTCVGFLAYGSKEKLFIDRCIIKK